MQLFRRENGRETVIINLVNETTSTGYAFATSIAMAQLLDSLTEEELAKLLPTSTPFAPDDPEEWASALVAHAKMGEMQGELWMEPLDLTTYWFSSEWESNCSNRESTRHDSSTKEATHRKPVWESTPDEFYVPNIDFSSVDFESDIVDLLTPFVPSRWEVWGFAIDREEQAPKRFLCSLVKKTGNPDADVDLASDEFAAYRYVGKGKFVFEASNHGEKTLYEHQPHDELVREWNPDIETLISFVKNIHKQEGKWFR